MFRSRLAKIKVEDRPEDFFTFLQVNGRSGEMRVTVCEAGTKAWTTTLGPTFFDGYARRLDCCQSVDQTIDSVFNILGSSGASGSESSTDKYIYQVAKVGLGTDIEFSWKKKVLSDNSDDEIIQKLGSVKLRLEDPGRSLALMLSFSIDRIGELERDMDSSIQEKDRLITERQRAISKLQQYVEDSVRMTTGLYTKFSAVINEKKQRIRELMANGKRLGIAEKEKPKETAPKRTAWQKLPKQSMQAGPSRMAVSENEYSGSDTDIEKQFQKISRKKSADVGRVVEDDHDLLLDCSTGESPVMDIKPAVPRQKRRTLRAPRRGPVPKPKLVVFCSSKSPSASLDEISGAKTMSIDSDDLMNAL